MIRNIKQTYRIGSRALALGLGLSFGLSAQAQTHLSVGDFSQARERFLALESRTSSAGEQPIDFKFVDKKFGALSVSFRSQPSADRHASFASSSGESKDSSEVLLLKGVGNINGVSIPVAGAVYRNNGKEELHVQFIAPGARSGSFISATGGTPFEIVQNLNADTAPKVEAASASALEGKRCGSEILPRISAPIISSNSESSALTSTARRAATTLRSIDVATEADFEYYSRHGSTSNSRIASIINAAQVIYERDLNLTFNIVRQRVRTTSSQPYTSRTSETLLDQLGAAVSSSGGLLGADVVHLFTGKDLDDNVVGLAWLGVLCTAPSLSTSLTQDVSTSVNFIIFAHEVGHNLGADHDSTLPRSLMYPMASSDQSTVSVRSANEIINYLNSGGSSCLSIIESTSPTPTPTPSATSTANPTASPTSEPRDGEGSGGGTTTPAAGLSASFNARTGALAINLSRKNFSAGTCVATVKLGGRSNLSDGISVRVESTAPRLRFASKTIKRLSSNRARIYIKGSFTGCESGESASSYAVEIQPLSARTTKKANKVSASTWNRSVVQKMTVSTR